MRTDDEIADAVRDMTWWLTSMLQPVDWDEVDQNPYRHLDDDELELGSRGADELLSEWAHRSVEGLCAVLSVRINHATSWRAKEPVAAAPEPVTESLLPDGPGTTVWSVPAYAPYVMPMEVLRSITAWMHENAVENASGAHEVRVEAHGDGQRTVVYQRGRSRSRYEAPDDTVVPARDLLRSQPPAVPAFPDLCELGLAIENHPVATAHFNMPLPIGSLVCVTCTTVAGVQQPVIYPCPTLVAAAAANGVEIYPDEEPDPRPKLVADPLADEFGVILT